MAVPGSGSPLLFSAEAAAPAGADTKSLRINSGDSAFLNRTPSSAGNQKTWTWSGWVKRSLLSGSDLGIFGARGTSATFLRFKTNQLDFVVNGLTHRRTTATFRDHSAWYHFVWAVDTTQATASDRSHFYVNGTEVTAWNIDSALTLDQLTDVNAAGVHLIGATDTVPNDKLDAYIADFYFIDGQQLTATDFGEFDATTGVWNPIAYSGSYGTNGFHLDFSDNSSASALGTDAAGSNDWTVNNISAPTVATYSLSSPSASDYISASLGSTVTLTAFTVEGWVYFTNGASQCAIHAPVGTSGLQIRWTSNTQFNIEMTNSAFILQSGTQTFNNNTWYHVVATRDSSNNVALGINGTFVATGTNSASIFIDSSHAMAVGRNYNGSAHNAFYASNVRVSTTDRYGTSGTYTVPTTPLSSDANTVYLVANSSTVTNDSKGTYSWTANGSVASTSSVSPFGTVDAGAGNDSLFDSPTNGTQTDTGAGGEVSGNYCTWNPLKLNTNGSLANGNLDWSSSTGGGMCAGTIGVSSDKWYWEVTVSGGTNCGIGVFDPSAALTTYIENSTLGIAYYGSAGSVFYYGGSAAYGSSFGSGDIIGVALDLDNGKIYFSKNGTWQNSGNPTTQTNPARTGLSGVYAPAIDAGASNAHSASLNTGQRAFAYTAPSGFKALCTANFDTPTIEDPSTVMDVALWTGNGTSQTISGLGFSPDLVWNKNRGYPDNHAITDTVRGATKWLLPNGTNSELTYTQSLTAFTSDGFSVGSDDNFNRNSYGFVGWCWDAGTSTASNTSGTITSQVRANISAGFSIVTFTSTNTNNATVGHGLGVAPKMVVIKNRDASELWWVLHEGMKPGANPWNNYTLSFNSTAGTSGAYGTCNGTAPTSSVVTLSNITNPAPNYGTDDKIMYCFAPVDGYCSIGSFTGNGSSDGPFVYTGMRPRFILYKCTSVSGDWWNFIDTARATYNPVGPYLESGPQNESSASVFDVLSNGFKPRFGLGNQWNGSGQNYVYMAWAESPFKYARAR